MTWIGGSPIYLPGIGGEGSGASAIDERGQIVGYARDTNPTRHAVIWRNLEVTNLNNEIPPGIGWLLKSATGINESGLIVGSGTLDGAPAAFLLTPN
ncbi:MAG: hypothetical protein ACR2HJ_08575 [Fimbriimonadales bacterium]